MSHTDDSFHEIQLNGKQLVFLFMVAVVVSSVIFLCGVLVGRGVRSERALADSQTLDDAATAEIAPTATFEPIPPDAAARTPPAPAVHELSYAEGLERGATEDSRAVAPSPKEPVRESAREPAAPSVAAPKPAAAPPAAAKPAAPPARAAAAPTRKPGEGYVVQVASLTARREAETRAKRLSAKGYAAYVEDPSAGVTSYRVRVGPFKTKREADAVAAKLRKEERADPWVTQ